MPTPKDRIQSSLADICEVIANHLKAKDGGMLNIHISVSAGSFGNDDDEPWKASLHDED